jgi:hypothetical protein
MVMTKMLPSWRSRARDGVLIREVGMLVSISVIDDDDGDVGC